MSVVVRMEMPKHCEYCPMCRLYRENGRVWCNAANRILKQEWKNPDWTELDIPKPDWCPILCQLPEGHGRLVDADALLRDIEKYHVSEGKFQHWLELQPTIVPAEAESPSPKPTDPLPIRGVEYVPTEVDVKTGIVTYEPRERIEP